MLHKYADKPILVVGGIGDNCRQIAETYVQIVTATSLEQC